MILYLGTSSLVKLYVEEDTSERVRRWIEDAEIVATCRVSYTEAISALEARYKRHDILKRDYEAVTDMLTSDWNKFVTMDFDEIETGRLVQKYGLRRFDAMHLSSALVLKRTGKNVSVAFSSSDERLNQAAASEGLEVLSSA